MRTTILLLVASLSLFGCNTTTRIGGVSAQQQQQQQQQATARNGIRQIHVVAYHGASYPLKDIHPDETTELTATGEKQMYNLGLWLQERYGGYLDHKNDPSLVRIDSSTHNRAVTSGMAIALGLYNTTSRDLNTESQLPNAIPRPNIPIYTPHYDKINDVTFRAYDTCTSYQSKLITMFATNPTIKDMLENDVDLKSILTKLASVKEFQKYTDPTSGMVRLQHVRDVVNVITVTKLECGGHHNNATTAHHNRTHACHQLPIVRDVLTDTEWMKLQQIAYQIELLKYSSDMAGTHIGGFILHSIIDRMLVAYQGTQDQETHMHIYSTTDTTLWGIAAALGEQKFLETVIGTNTTGSSVKTLLPYGSAFIFELHGSASSPLPTAQLIVDMYFKSGDTNNATLIGTICGHSQIKDHCPLLSLTQYVNMNVTKSTWCKDCNNDSAEICIREALKKHTTPISSSPSTPSNSLAVCSEPKLSTAGSMILGIVIGTFLSMFGYCYYLYRRSKRASKNVQHRTATTSARANTANNNHTFDTEDDDNIFS